MFGCFAPDFGYFIGLPKGEFGHTWPGLFLLDLPLGLIMLWLFHRYAKQPLWILLPEGVRQRVKLGPGTLPLKGVTRFTLVLASILVGGATHIVWDSFTHPVYWPYRHWHLLSRTARLPVLGDMPYYKLFQYASTAVGMVILLLWFIGRVSAATPVPSRNVPGSRLNERPIFAAAFAIALTGGAIHALAGLQNSAWLHMTLQFTAGALITAISVFWAELVIYGVVRDTMGRYIQAA